MGVPCKTQETYENAGKPDAGKYSTLKLIYNAGSLKVYVFATSSHNPGSI